MVFTNKMKLLAIGFGYLAIPIVLSLTTGCRCLTADWKPAVNSKLEFPSIKGIATLNQSSEKYLVIEYWIFEVEHVWGHDYTKYYVAIPLKDFTPPDPLIYSGPLCPVREIENHISKNQELSLLDFRFSKQAFALGAKLAAQNQFITTDQKNAEIFFHGEGAEFSGINDKLLLSRGNDHESTRFDVIPYWNSEPVIEKDSRSNQFSYSDFFEKPPKLKPPSHQIFLPSEIQRLPGDSRKVLCVAILKTPVDFCEDIIVTPILYVPYFIVFKVFRCKMPY